MTNKEMIANTIIGGLAYAEPSQDKIMDLNDALEYIYNTMKAEYVELGLKPYKTIDTFAEYDQALIQLANDYLDLFTF